MATASVVLSVIRIALNLGSGRQDYVQVDVVSEAGSVEQARLEGFRTAVNQAVGSVIATQTEVQNSRLVRDEIINYSSGYVDRFEIQSQTWQGNRVRLQMRVWVAESRLAHRLLGRSMDNKQIPGSQLGAQIQTLLDERQQGDRLMSAVLADFPDRAFDIQSEPSRAQLNNRRQVIIETQVTVRWNPAWANSVYEVLDRTRDPVKHAQVYNVALTTDPKLQMLALDSHGQVLHKSCYEFTINPSNTGYNKPTRYLMSIQNDRVFLDTRYKVGGLLQLNFGQETQILQRVHEIRVKIVPNQQC